MENIRLTGELAFSRLKSLDPEYNSWNITLYVDKENQQAYVKAGGQGEFRTDENGDKIILRRYPTLKLTTGEVKDMGPPYVRYKGENYNRIVGNGSTVVAEVQPYEYKKNGGGIGMRLVGITVTNLVEYVPKDAD